MTVYTSDWQETVEVVTDATYSDYDRMVEKYHEKDAPFAVRNLVREVGRVEVLRLHEVDA